MSLSNAKPNLETAILAAFDRVFETAKSAGANDASSQIRKELAKDLADAIHAYVTKADVNINSVEGAGLGVTLQSKAAASIPVSVATPAGPAVGATTAPGVVIHTGRGKLE